MSPNLEQSYKFLLQISEITYTSLKFWVINIPSLYASDLSSGQFAKSAKFAKFVLHIDLSGIAVYLGWKTGAVFTHTPNPNTHSRLSDTAVTAN